MYNSIFFPTNDDEFRIIKEHGPSWPVLHEYHDRETPTLLGSLGGGANILVLTEETDGRIEACAIHFVLLETRKACRKDLFRAAPFFKPEGGTLWHSAVEYGGGRAPLAFAVANAFPGAAFDECSGGGVFEMVFAGIGEWMECLNGKGVIRFRGGKPLARERRDRKDPSLDHVDVTFSEMKALNSCNDAEKPAFAEFTSTIENVESETICGQPCYRIRLWSGPPPEPASFPWTLLIAKSRVQKGWIPRVGDFVNGVAALFGTFNDKPDGAEPTVFQDVAETGTWMREEPVEDGEAPPVPSGKPEFEWLPRAPREYPDAPAPRIPLPAFKDEPFKKFVTYPEYRRRLGDVLEPVKPPSRKRLKEIVGEIDHVLETEGGRAVFAPRFDAIGIRHAVRDPVTGETHLWLGLPPVSVRWECHAGLLVALGADGHALRYTLHTGDDRWAHGEWACRVSGFKAGSESRNFDTPAALLAAIPSLKKDGFAILSAQCHGSMMQAACTRAGKRREFLVEMQVFGMEWQFFAKHVKEARLLELFRLFLDGGLAAVANEEPWRQVRMKGSH